VTIQQLYDQSIKNLPAAERLRLATLILNDIPSEAVIDYREGWSDEDLQDFSRASWEHVHRLSRGVAPGCFPAPLRGEHTQVPTPKG
jgi:hypothetical protein